MNLFTLVLVLVVVLLPSIPTASGSRAIGQARHAFAPRVLAVLAVSILTFAGMQAAITYLVPFLDEITGVEGGIVTAYLLLYGVATTVGSVLGGRFADANAPRVLVIGAAGVAASLGLMLAFGGSPWIAVLAGGLAYMIAIAAAGL